MSPAWEIYDMTARRIPTDVEAREYVSELVAAYPSICEVWLFGSRANGSTGLESDWDYMVFADDATYTALCSDSRFHRDGIDPMIVTDGDHFAAPWTDHSRLKSGRLAKVGGGWCWHRVSPTKATYRATKPPKVEGGDVQVFERCALRVYPQRDEDVAQGALSAPSPARS